MHTMQENVDKQQVRDSIENVLVAYVVKNPQFGYSQVKYYTILYYNHYK